MKIYRYESIGSTSTEVAKLFSQGVKPPFAVTAKVQTTGRGTGSRTWQSPLGNLYLSLAVNCEREGVGSMPLKVGVLLALWLQQEFNITPVLKWPNDILIQSQKLAGILCEANWQQGNSNCDVIVGIGFNVNVAPELDTDYRATCLRHATGREWDTDKLLRSLVNDWEKNELKWSNKELYLDEYRKLHLPHGQLLQDTVRPDDLYSFETIDHAGCLVVRNLKDGSPRSIVTAHHTLRWQLVADP